MVGHHAWLSNDANADLLFALGGCSWRSKSGITDLRRIARKRPDDGNGNGNGNGNSSHRGRRELPRRRERQLHCT
jgi:hypothetical protein